MRIGVQSRKDLLAGLVFVAFGLFFMLVGRTYPLGTAVRMGPGYFPSILGGVLAILGAVIAVRAFWVEGSPLTRVGFRPLLLVLGAVLAFAFLVQSFGLVVATLVLVFGSALGGSEFRVGEVALLSVLLAVLAVAVFSYALGLPFKIWPW